MSLIYIWKAQVDMYLVRIDACDVPDYHQPEDLKENDLEGTADRGLGDVSRFHPLAHTFCGLKRSTAS